MPARNRIKIYNEDSYYHLYNRGVDKRAIFTDEQDYGVFLSYLKIYLLPKDLEGLYALIANPKASPQQKHQAHRILLLNNFSGDIDLVAYNLMPNHFHFLIHQQSADAIDKFMNSLGTRYAMYFNKRHHRVGTLFQDLYKAVAVTSDEQLLHLSRYIHRNSFYIDKNGTFKQPSSYAVYLGKIKQNWVHPEIILEHFDQKGFNSYQSFVEFEDADHEQHTLTTVSKIAIDLDEEE